MSVLNVAGYRFVTLDELPALREALLAEGRRLGLRGTILLSEEGINLMLAGSEPEMTAFLDGLLERTPFQGMTFHKTWSSASPFQRFKVKIRREIITLRRPSANPRTKRAPSVSPGELSRWLDENRPVLVLDTRNEFEIRHGGFKGALNPGIKDFSEFPKAIEHLPRDLPVVMYCTGGIRCEKAALVMLEAGFADVRQLEGGILGYFAEVGGAHYEGSCFVFDERVALDSSLQPVSERSF